MIKSFHDLSKFIYYLNGCFVLFKDFIYLFIKDTQRETERGREKQSLFREPDVGLNPRTPGLRPGPKAGTKPQSHPGIPHISYCILTDTHKESVTYILKL